MIGMVRLELVVVVTWESLISDVVGRRRLDQRRMNRRCLELEDLIRVED